MDNKIKEAALWMAKKLRRTPTMARKKFGLKPDEMIQLYATYAQLRAEVKSNAVH